MRNPTNPQRITAANQRRTQMRLEQYWVDAFLKETESSAARASEPRKYALDTVEGSLKPAM